MRVIVVSANGKFAAMRILRTPEERFSELSGFAYRPEYCEIDDGEGGRLRVAWVEHGPAHADPVLMLHGEPSWSFLYRRMIPIVAAAGYRVVCPDLVGFGRSDKPAEISDHTYARHVEWMRAFAFDVLDLKRVTLVGQDWGGLIGLRLAAEHPDRFARIVVANTGLPTGDLPMPDIWWEFRKAIQGMPELEIGRFVQSGCTRPMTDEVRACYDAPFPDDSYCAGPRAMPGLVPTTPAIRPRPPTVRRGSCCATARPRCWWRSATAIPSRVRWGRSSAARCEAHRVSTTP